MEKQQIDYKRIEEQYKKSDPEVSLAIEELRNMKDKYQMRQKILAILRHDALSQITNIKLLSNPKRWSRLSKEKQNERIVLINNKAEVAYDAMGFLNITDLTKESLNIYSENINIAAMAKTRARSIEDHLNKIPIALEIKSSEQMGYPLEIYANKAVFGSIIENLLGGSLNNALESSKAKLGIREEKGYLEIMSENIHIEDKSIRKIAGEARGLGLPFIKMATEAYNGEFELYKTKKIDRLYEDRSRFGIKGEVQKYPEARIFGVKISIPMKELEKQ